MRTVAEILRAKEILEIPDRATLEDIKECYRRLMKKWHPDRCAETPETCKDMAEKINAAYRTILEYCRGYRFSFTEEGVKAQLSGEEWMFDRFGDDPIWGR